MSDYQLSTTQVCILADVSFRQLDHWVRIGRVCPAVEAGGSGTRRRWTWDDVGRIEAVGRVSRAIGHKDTVLDLVAANWSTGSCDLGDGVTITWPVED